MKARGPGSQNQNAPGMESRHRLSCKRMLQARPSDADVKTPAQVPALKVVASPLSAKAVAKASSAASSSTASHPPMKQRRAEPGADEVEEGVEDGEPKEDDKGEPPKKKNRLRSVRLRAHPSRRQGLRRRASSPRCP